MYDELIYWMESLARGTAGRKVARAAADAIDALQAENGSKDREIERLTALAQNGASAIDTNKRLADTLARVEAERDAAMKDVPHDCEHCKTGDCYIRNGTEHCHWLWRGAQGEGQDET